MPRSQKPKPSFLRQVTKSVAGLLPGDLGDNVDDKLARILAGLQSQVMSRDPETGELYLGGLQALKDDWNGIKYKDRKRHPRPGIVDETLSLPTLMSLAPVIEQKLTGGTEYTGGVEEAIPDWAFEAADRADAMHKASRDEMGLDESKGFAQNAAEGLGTMLGQMPIPLTRAKSLTSAPRTMGSALKKTIGGIPEWFSPTVDPSMANYLSGAAFGGGMGALTDYFADQAAEQEENDQFSQNIRPMVRSYVKSGHMPGFDLRESLRQNPVNEFAEGGKVAKLLHFVIDRQTGQKVSSGYQNKMLASRRADRLDNEYGAYRYQVKSEVAPEGTTRLARTRDQDDIPAFGTDSSVTKKLAELKKMHEDGLLEPKVYDDARVSLESVKDRYAEGGKVGALHEALKAISMNPHAKFRNQHSAGYLHEDPIEDIIYAAREAGVPDEDRRRLVDMLNASKKAPNLSDELIDRLLNLHSQVFKTDDIITQKTPILRPNAPVDESSGLLPVLPWDAILSLQSEK